MGTTKLDINQLKDGTDGELITWDAAGAPAVVAAGTAAQVLTSNGAGAAPTFQDAAGGGAWNLKDYSTGSGTTFDITSLDLDTDKRYRIIFKAHEASGTNQNLVKLKINSTSGSTYYDTYIEQKYSGSHGSSSGGDTSVTEWRIGDGTMRDYTGTIDIDEAADIQATIDIVGRVNGANTTYFSRYIGSLWESGETNLTSLNWSCSNSLTWECWVLYPSTS